MNKQWDSDLPQKMYHNSYKKAVINNSENDWNVVIPGGAEGAKNIVTNCGKS